MSTNLCIRSIRLINPLYRSRFYEDNSHIYFYIFSMGGVRP